MKQLIVYHREVTERTGFKKYPFKKIDQYYVVYGGQEYATINNAPSPSRDRLRVKYEIVLNTRNKADIERFLMRITTWADSVKELRKALFEVLKND